MVYDRRYDEGTLTFEASGALRDAALVMRDRETDSWWSVMAGVAIDGARKGELLQETGLAVKTIWGDWRAKHPDTRVLSIEGREHEPENVYADYHGSERTWRDTDAKDDRLPAKTPVFAFRWDGKPHAVRQDRLGGGILWRPEGAGDDDPVVLLYRVPDAPLGVSTTAAILPREVSSLDDPEGLAAKLDERLATQTSGVTRLPGFDTYWYTWASQNPGTVLID